MIIVNKSQTFALFPQFLRNLGICLQCSSFHVPSRPILHVMHTLHKTDQPGLVAASDYEPALNIPANFIGLFEIYARETQPYFKFQYSFTIINQHGHLLSSKAGGIILPYTQSCREQIQEQLIPENKQKMPVTHLRNKVYLNNKTFVVPYSCQNTNST